MASSSTPPTSYICDDANWPFEKKTHELWSVVESMEVFQKMPQKPHFQPLEHLAGFLREGKAIEHMVNFSNVLERSSSPEFLNEPKSSTDQLLEKVAELEENGFHLQIVRHRIAMKENIENLKEQIEEFKAEFQSSVASFGKTAGVNPGMGSISGNINETSEMSPVNAGQLSLGSGQKRVGTMPRKFD